MSKITFGRQIDMVAEGVPPNGASLIGYHSGGGGYPAGSLLQKNSSGEISYVGGGVGPAGPTGSGGGTTFLEVTKTELDVLIAGNSLIPGTIYKISGVHKTRDIDGHNYIFYDDGTNSGTTIFLTALTTNELSKEGYGEFWNPKYDQSIDGFGIWDRKSEWVPALLNSNVLSYLTPESFRRMVMDTSENIYTNNYSLGTISKITPSGTNTTFATVGTQPVDISVDTMDNIFVLNRTSQNINKITPGGTVSTLASISGYASNMVIDSIDNLYVLLETSTNNIIKITPGGTVSTLASLGVNANMMIIDVSDNLYTISSGIIHKITTLGGVSTMDTVDTNHIYISVDSSGNVYSSGNTNIIHKTTSGGVTTIFKTIISVSTTSLSVINGNFLYTLLGNNKLGRVSLISNIFEEMGNSGNAYDIILDSLGNIYTSGYNSIYKISLTTQIGNFYLNENITSNNGATGKIVDHIKSNKFIAISGDWVNSTSITGNSSGATCNISGVVLKNFSISDKVIFGGYSWTNINGLVGNNLDILNLDSEWSKDLYSYTNYNKVLDIISYDYINDWIGRRYSVEEENDVIFTFLSESNMWFEYSPIVVFMFGNKFNPDTYYKGCSNNKLINSYFECVNFIGDDLTFNELTDSTIKDSSFNIGCSFRGNKITSSSSTGLSLSSGFYDNVISLSSIYYILVYGYFRWNKANNSTIWSSNFLGYFEQNIMDRFTIRYVEITPTKSLAYNTFKEYSDIFGISNNYIIINLSISFLTMYFASLRVDITNATIIYGNHEKTIYKSSVDASISNTYKIRYYNNTGLVIAELTD